MRTEQEMYQLILEYAWKDPKIRGLSSTGPGQTPQQNWTAFVTLTSYI